MWRLRVGSFVVALVLASAVDCGGGARTDGLVGAPPINMSAGGANAAGAAGSRVDSSAGGAMPTTGGAAGAGGAGGAGGSEADSDLSNSCPQASSDHSCSAVAIDVRFTRDAVGPGAGVWVEPLQIPDYSLEFPATQPGLEPKVEPSDWDRSPLPAGACVLRIHGLSGACLQPGALYVGTCAALSDPATPRISSVSFYEALSCRQGIAPGCPSAGATTWGDGNWWYLVARGEDTDLVLCAPQCAGLFSAEKHACLRMAGSG